MDTRNDGDRPSGRLPAWRRLLVVVAHPDDESFGLGAVVDAFVRAGTAVHVLCLTRGEASTLTGGPDLAAVRARELEQAAHELGAGSTELLDLPDGGLAAVPIGELDAAVRRTAEQTGADGMLTFDPSGVSGHPDHVAATASAVRVAGALGLDVLAWTLTEEVASRLRDESGVPFTGHDEAALDLRLEVERGRQGRAISCHASQALPGSVLWRRLELQGDSEVLRWLAVRPG